MPTRNLIFVDVDGVLNVGLSQGENNTLMLSLRNMALARRVQLDIRASKSSKDAAESLFNLASAPLSGEVGTLQKFMCPDHGISDVLVERLAKLILAAGDSAHVVLSSSWRHERHIAKRQLLEGKIGKCLGRSFAFHGVTADRKEHTGGDRLELLGDYAKEYSQQLPKDDHLQVLVLDDFFLCPMGWTIGETAIESEQEMTSYLESRVNDRPVRVKVVYMYDEWTMRLGKLHASIGLQMSFYLDALNFLQDKAFLKVEEKEKLQQLQPSDIRVDIPQTRPALLLKSVDDVLNLKRTEVGGCRSVILAL